MKLREYFKEMCINRKEFAKKVGVTANTIANVVTGEKDIHLSTAVRIEEMTEGKVTCRELVARSFMKRLEDRSKQLKNSS